MGFAVSKAKEVLLLHKLGDHGREMPIFIIFYLFLPNSIVVKRKEGNKKGER